MRTVDRQEFIDAVEDFISLYVSDYVSGEPTYEMTHDEPDEPDYRTATVRFKSSHGLDWAIPIGIDGDGEIGIHMYEDNYIPLSDLYLYLWHEAAACVIALKKTVKSAKRESCI